MSLLKTPDHRHWDMVHAGVTYSMGWEDGERLMILCNEVINGVVAPQTFSFMPINSRTPGMPAAIFVTADDPIELFTNYAPDIPPMPSGWFG